MKGVLVSTGDSESIKQQLADLQERYNTESEQHKNELAERDYMDAVNSAVAELKFSSKGAKTAFVAGLKEKKLELKDGKLVGFEQHLKDAQESDPEAFQPD